jgi:glycosyltransferase involved in cell wall biosynthesis
MRIVISIGTLGQHGGAERAVSYLSRMLAKEGHEIHLVSFYNYQNIDNVYGEYEGVTYHYLNQDIDKRKASRLREAVTLLSQVVSAISPDVIVAMTSYYGMIAYFAAYGKAIPVIVSERNNPRSLNRLNWMKRALFKYIYRRCDGSVFQTEKIRQFYFPKSHQGVVIPNAIVIESLPEPKSSYNTTKSFVFVGRLVSEKNIFLLLDAVCAVRETHPDYKLFIYGDGYLRNDISKYIESKKQGSHIVLRGVSDNVFALFEEHDIFVMSSDSEGMPNALIEAMAMGMPVIATDCDGGGAAELITSGENGLLVEKGNVSRLTDALMYMIERPEEAVRMGTKASDIRKKLDSKLIARKWNEYIEEVVYENSR